MNDGARTPAEATGDAENTEEGKAVSGVERGNGTADQGGHRTGGVRGTRAEWPLYEVFVRGKRGLNHVHVGSLRAADDRMALTHARDLYTRRNEGVSLWAVRSDLIAASAPDEKDPFFAPNADKVYRHPTFYDIPADVPHI